MARLDHSSTDAKLLDALLSLLETESLYRVQVSELCARARVNRTTFYKHYESIDAYLMNVESAFLEKMNGAFFYRNVFMHALEVDAYQTCLQCVRFMAENGALARALLGPNGSPTLRGRLSDMWAHQAEEALLMRFPRIQETMNLEMASTCAAASMLALLELYLAKPGKYSDEQFAGQMENILYGRLLAVDLAG